MILSDVQFIFSCHLSKCIARTIPASAVISGMLPSPFWFHAQELRLYLCWDDESEVSLENTVLENSNLNADEGRASRSRKRARSTTSEARHC